MRSIKGVILGLGAFEKVKRYNLGTLSRVTVARKPDLFEAGFATR
jgi:hypothetical protein